LDDGTVAFKRLCRRHGSTVKCVSTPSSCRTSFSASYLATVSRNIQCIRFTSVDTVRCQCQCQSRILAWLNCCRVHENVVHKFKLKCQDMTGETRMPLAVAGTCPEGRDRQCRLRVYNRPARNRIIKLWVIVSK